MAKISPGQEKAFAEEFLKEYLKVGFGRMNKSDLEILIFHLLKEYSDIRDKSNFEVSTTLKVPVSKVAALDYQCKLLYPENRTFTDRLWPILEDARFDIDHDRVRFSIEDKYLRLELQSKMKELNSFADTSFNSEIVSISVQTFTDFLEKYFPDKVRSISETISKALPKLKPTDSFKNKLLAYVRDLSISIFSELLGKIG